MFENANIPDFKENVNKITSELNRIKLSDDKYKSISETVITTTSTLYAIQQLQDEVSKSMDKVKGLPINDGVKAEVNKLNQIADVGKRFLDKIKMLTNYPVEILADTKLENLLDKVLENLEVIDAAMEKQVPTSAVMNK